MANKLPDIQVMILAPKGDHEHVERLKLPYKITSYVDTNGFDEKSTIILRWGAGWAPRYRETEYKYPLPHYEKIADNCDKLNAAKKLAEVVKTPELCEKRVKKKKLFVVRPTHHARGEDFKVQKGPFKVPDEHYAKEFINSSREVRVWYAAGRTLCARRVTGNPKRLGEKFKCRSMWSYKFWKRTPRNLHRQVLAAAKHMGTPFGAFDIIYKKGKWYFLENNTAIAVDHKKIISLFNRGITTLIRRKVKEIKLERKKNPPIESKFTVVSYETEKPAITFTNTKTQQEAKTNTNGFFNTFVKPFTNRFPSFNYFGT